MFEKNLVKILKAVDLIARPSGCTIKEIESEIGISRRSVYRLLETLQELNFPIYDEKIPYSREKRWKFEEGYLKKLPNIDMPQIKFTPKEIIILHYLMHKSATLKGTQFEDIIKAIYEKLGILISHKQLEKFSFEKLESLFITSEKLTKDYSGKEDIIDCLMDAIIEQKTCVVTYHAFSTDEKKEFRIDPLKIFEHQGGLYIFVNVTRFNSIRILAIERIQEINLLNENFEYPENFNPEELLDSAFQITFDDPIEAKIWFSKDQARYIEERKWSQEQHIEKQDGGSIILTIKTSGIFDLKKWVLSFGADAKVIQPRSLRKKIFKEMSIIKKYYT